MKSSVVPLKVPWMASPSSPGARMECGPPHESTQGVVFIPASFKAGRELATKHGNNVVVELVLVDCRYTKFYPSYSTEDHQRVDEYSWDAVPSCQWESSEECPDPGAYEVRDSDIVARLGLDGFVHGLIPGDEYSVEFVARAWSWRVAAVELPR